MSQTVGNGDSRANAPAAENNIGMALPAVFVPSPTDNTKDNNVVTGDRNRQIPPTESSTSSTDNIGDTSIIATSSKRGRNKPPPASPATSPTDNTGYLGFEMSSNYRIHFPGQIDVLCFPPSLTDNSKVGGKDYQTKHPPSSPLTDHPKGGKIDATTRQTQSQMENSRDKAGEARQ